jgi:superfamily II DNA or RNA helicase
MIGLSATPEEKDGPYHKILSYQIGDILDVEKIENYSITDNKFYSNVDIIKYEGPDEFTQLHINEKTGLLNAISTISDLVSDPFRNRLIVQEIYKLFQRKLNIFVFSDRRQHLIDLYELFQTYLQEQICNSSDFKISDIIQNIQIPEVNELQEKYQILYGGSSLDDINNAINKSKVIFTTYQYSSTGVSIIKMNALVLSTPRRSNMEQILGRIFRLGGREEIRRHIIDIVDIKTGLKNQSYSRKKIYESLKYDIAERCIHFNKVTSF